MFTGTPLQPLWKIRSRGRAAPTVKESTTMAEDTSKERSDGWREMIAQWEKGINTLAHTTMNSDEFSSSANGSMSLALRAQQAMATAMATYLATLNLPSRTDVTAISDRLASIEATMLRVADALEARQPSTSKRGRRVTKIVKPRRTKRPPGEAATQ